MKKIMILAFTLIFLNKTFAQVGIGTNAPASSAALDISDSTKGLLIPRMTMANRQAIVNPAKGLMVYQTNNTRGLWYYDGSAWQNFSNASLSTDTGFIYEVKSKTGEIVAVYTNSNAYAYSNAWFGGPWYPVALTGTALGAFAVDYAIVIYTTTAAYGFDIGGWTTKSIAGTPIGINGNANMIVLATTTNLYGYTQASDTGLGGYSWQSQQSISGTPRGSLAGFSPSMFGINSCVVVYTDSSIYAFASNVTEGITPYWASQALSGPVQGSSISGSLSLVYTAINAYSFGVGASAWSVLPLSGAVVGVYP